MVFGLTRQWLEPDIYGTRDVSATYYTTDATYDKLYAENTFWLELKIKSIDKQLSPGCIFMSVSGEINFPFRAFQ